MGSIFSLFIFSLHFFLFQPLYHGSKWRHWTTKIQHGTKAGYADRKGVARLLLFLFRLLSFRSGWMNHEGKGPHRSSKRRSLSECIDCCVIV
ncbi:hypothetical protein QBC38DRAFT_23876 [Podospora fimiseda]|uniref:Uncharacterized protein n=1 Tax=Podospora fimiseda TaxID=252190 RepID=A0AAN7GTV2_9PEZI|nr:hypothetical protein QBC38DRAFT_23876 [Podospora fimiseda]